MTATLIDLARYKVTRTETRAYDARPYSSMDDLPDVTPAGQRAIWDLLFPPEKPRP